MKEESKFKVKFVEWKKNVFSIAEKIFGSEDEAKKEAENHSGQVKIYNIKGQPVHNKPEKPPHPVHPEHPKHPEHPEHPYH